jgi:hypothetical protein
MFNPLNAELNPICHLLALLGGATIVVVSGLRVNIKTEINLSGAGSLCVWANTKENAFVVGRER